MMENKRNRNQGSGQSSWFTWNSVFWMIVLLLLFNGIFYPFFGKEEVRDADYITFLQDVQKGKVKKVLIKDDVVYFTMDEKVKQQSLLGSNAKKAQPKYVTKEVTYKTVEVNDP